MKKSIIPVLFVFFLNFAFSPANAEKQSILIGDAASLNKLVQKPHKKKEHVIKENKKNQGNVSHKKLKRKVKNCGCS